MRTALLTARSQDSIGRIFGRFLLDQGWSVFLYSRDLDPGDEGNLHQRRCDVRNASGIDAMLEQTGPVDLAVQLADSGTGFGELVDASEDGIRDFVDAKITGSLLLTRALIRQSTEHGHHVKLLWAAGSNAPKPKHIFLYSPINVAIERMVLEINRHYADRASAWYLPTPLVIPSPLGRRYLDTFPEQSGANSIPPEHLLPMLSSILSGRAQPGVLEWPSPIL